MEQHPRWKNLRKGQRKLSPRLREELELEIVAAYQRMQNTRAVAHYVNRSDWTVRQVLETRGVSRRKPGRPPKPETWTPNEGSSGAAP